MILAKLKYFVITASIWVVDKIQKVENLWDRYTQWRLEMYVKYKNKENS